MIDLSEEPIAQRNDEARRRLGPLVDAFLMHNREIYARYDDSVVFHAGPAAGGLQFIRRSRGYAPFPITLPFQVGQILTTGPELKNTFCLTRDVFYFFSQHIGHIAILERLDHVDCG